MPALSQSLYEDVNALTEAVEYLEKNSIKDKPAECKRATAKIVAILEHYSKADVRDTTSALTWAQIKKKYESNAFLKSVLNDTLLAISIPDTTIRQFSQELRLGARQKMVQQQAAQSVLSPGYLSIAKTMERYQTPVYPPVQALALSAKNSNRNMSDGVFSSQAAIIEGLARFVLDRAKDEVVINFLDRLVKEETPNFLVLFPTVASEFGNKNFMYSDAFVNRLRQAFYEDLQKLSVRLPLLMLEDDYFKPLQSDPVAYNMMVIYSLVSMLQLEKSVEESVPAVNTFIGANFSERIKEVNLLISKKATTSSDYNELIKKTESTINQLKNIYLQLNNAEEKIRKDTEGVRKKYPNSPSEPRSIDFLKPYYNLDVLFGNDPFGIELLPQLLKGELDSSKILNYNSISSYDKFFGTERQPEQWRGAGLEILQKLSGTWYSEQSLIGILKDWHFDLMLLDEAANKWMEKTDTEGALKKAQQRFESDVEALKEAINDERSFWNDKMTHDQKLALLLLDKLVEQTVFDNIDFETQLETFSEPVEAVKLNRKRQHWAAVETRFLALDTLLYGKNPLILGVSPAKKYMTAKQVTAPYAYIGVLISDFDNALTDLKKQLRVVEEKIAPIESRARDNAKPVLQVTGVASDLMYCLRSNEEGKKWLTSQQLNLLLDGKKKESIFLGLMHQKLNSRTHVGAFSAKGLTELVQLTIKDIDLMNDLKLPDSLKKQDTMAFFRKAAFAVHTLNRIIEVPLIADINTNDRYIALKDRFVKLKAIPTISEDVLDFIYFINIKKHTKAIGSLISVLGNLTTKTNDELKGIKAGINKRESVIQYLSKYGDFIAGLVDAQRGEEVEILLKQIADPPGSSRIKRNTQLSVSINAYFGGTVGYESWSGDALTKNENFYSPALTMPIGITVSGLFGAKRESFSAFISFLDLGAVLTYKPKSISTVETDFTFKNVFKPGIQIHWNIKKSPFYLGVGWQYGPQYISVNDKQKPVSSNRYFLGFGVDVPIRTVYQR